MTAVLVQTAAHSPLNCCLVWLKEDGSVIESERHRSFVTRAAVLAFALCIALHSLLMILEEGRRGAVGSCEVGVVVGFLEDSPVAMQAWRLWDCCRWSCLVFNCGIFARRLPIHSAASSFLMLENDVH